MKLESSVVIDRHIMFYVSTSIAVGKHYFEVFDILLEILKLTNESYCLEMIVQEITSRICIISRLLWGSKSVGQKLRFSKELFPCPKNGVICKSLKTSRMWISTLTKLWNYVVIKYQKYHKCSKNLYRKKKKNF